MTIEESTESQKSESTQPHSTEESESTQPTSTEESQKTTEKKPETTEDSKPTQEPTKPVETHIHSFTNPTCTEPGKCSCGATSGSKLGHDFGSNNKTCSRCGVSNPNYKEPEPEGPTTEEIAFYTSNDLVSKGVVPEGYCSGTTVRVYIIRNNGHYEEHLAVSFSGKPMSRDYCGPNIIDNGSGDGVLRKNLRAGTSEDFIFAEGGMSIN